MQPPDKKFLAVLLFGSLTCLFKNLPVALASQETTTTTSTSTTTTTKTTTTTTTTADFDSADAYGAPPVCKPGFEITTIHSCKAAASRMNVEFVGTEYDQAYPSGCYKYMDNRVYFNFESGFDAAPGCSRICFAGGAPTGSVVPAGMGNIVWNVTGDENVMTLVGEMGHKFALFEGDAAGNAVSRDDIMDLVDVFQASGGANLETSSDSAARLLCGSGGDSSFVSVGLMTRNFLMEEASVLRDGYTFACRESLLDALEGSAVSSSRMRRNLKSLLASAPKPQPLLQPAQKRRLQQSVTEKKILDSMLTQFQIAYDAIVVVVRKGSWLEKELVTSKGENSGLSVNQLRGIYSGNMATWADVLKDMRITLSGANSQVKTFRPVSPSSIVDLFQQRIMTIASDGGASDIITPFVTGATGHEFTNASALVTSGQFSDNSIAFFSYREYEQHHTSTLSAIPISAVDGGEPVDVSPDTITSGAYQPLTRNLYLVVRNRDLWTLPSLSRFPGFIFGNTGQGVLGNVPGFASLSAAGMAEQRSRVGQLLGTSSSSSDSSSGSSSTTSSKRLVRELTGGLDACRCLSYSPLHSTNKYNKDSQTVTAFVTKSTWPFGENNMPPQAYDTRTIIRTDASGNRVADSTKGVLMDFDEDYGVGCGAWDWTDATYGSGGFCEPRYTGASPPTDKPGANWLPKNGGWVQAWCEQRFCWVDPNDCHAANEPTNFYSWTDTSIWNAESGSDSANILRPPAYYSYTTCGNVDSFTVGKKKCIETIRIGGSSTLSPVVKLWAAELEDRFPDRYCVEVVEKNATTGLSLGSEDAGKAICNSGTGSSSAEGELDIATMSSDWGTDDTQVTRLYDGYTLECCKDATWNSSSSLSSSFSSSSVTDGENIISPRNARCRNNWPSIRFTQFEVGFDAIVVLVQSDSTAHRCINKMFGNALSVAQLRWIFSRLADTELSADGMDVAHVVPGRRVGSSAAGNNIKLWSDLDSGCAAEPIKILGLSEVHGTNTEFRRRIFGNSAEQFRDNYQNVDNVEAIVSEMSGVRGFAAISFAPYNRLQSITTSNKQKLHFVPIHASKTQKPDDQNTNIPIETPTLSNIRDGSYKTLKSSLFLNVRNDRWDKLEVFVRIALGVQGQRVLARNGQIKLGEATRQASVDRLNKKILTMYNIIFTIYRKELQKARLENRALQNTTFNVVAKQVSDSPIVYCSSSAIVSNGVVFGLSQSDVQPCLDLTPGLNYVKYCPVGTYSSNNKCFACSDGMHQPQSDHLRSDCVTCPVGTYSNSELFKPRVDENIIFTLEMAPFRGKQLCKPSEPGYFINGTAFTNIGHICPQGRSCEAGSANPKLCPVGTMQDLEGQASCKSCSLQGGYQVAEGQTFCFDCPMNSYTVPSSGGGARQDSSSSEAFTYAALSNVDLTRYCKLCDSGTFSSAYGAVGAASCSREYCQSEMLDCNWRDLNPNRVADIDEKHLKGIPADGCGNVPRSYAKWYHHADGDMGFSKMPVNKCIFPTDYYGTRFNSCLHGREGEARVGGPGAWCSYHNTYVDSNEGVEFEDCTQMCVKENRLTDAESDELKRARVCPSGWKCKGNLAYKLFGTEPRPQGNNYYGAGPRRYSWEEAKEECEKLGDSLGTPINLAKIETMEQAEFVRDVVGNNTDVWIGLAIRGYGLDPWSAEWKWVSIENDENWEPASFENWESGYPYHVGEYYPMECASVGGLITQFITGITKAITGILVIQAGSAGWINTGCEKNFAYVCSGYRLESEDLFYKKAEPVDNSPAVAVKTTDTRQFGEALAFAYYIGEVPAVKKGFYGFPVLIQRSKTGEWTKFDGEFVTRRVDGPRYSERTPAELQRQFELQHPLFHGENHNGTTWFVEGSNRKPWLDDQGSIDFLRNDEAPNSLYARAQYHGRFGSGSGVVASGVQGPATKDEEEDFLLGENEYVMNRVSLEVSNQLKSLWRDEEAGLRRNDERDFFLAAFAAASKSASNEESASSTTSSSTSSSNSSSEVVAIPPTSSSLGGGSFSSSDLLQFQGWVIYECGDGVCGGRKGIQESNICLGENRDVFSTACSRCLPGHYSASAQNIGNCEVCPSLTTIENADGTTTTSSGGASSVMQTIAIVLLACVHIALFLSVLVGWMVWKKTRAVGQGKLTSKKREEEELITVQSFLKMKMARVSEMLLEKGGGTKGKMSLTNKPVGKLGGKNQSRVVAVSSQEQESAQIPDQSFWSLQGSSSSSPRTVAKEGNHSAPPAPGRGNIGGNNSANMFGDYGGDSMDMGGGDGAGDTMNDVVGSSSAPKDTGAVNAHMARVGGVMELDVGAGGGAGVNIPNLPDLPGVNIPNLPNIDLPNVDLPDLNLPAINIPDIIPPSLQLPTLPDVDLPTFDGFDFDVSAFELPDMPDIPNIDRPNINLPNIQINPDMPDMPNINLPNVNMPKLPVLMLPKVPSLPDVDFPDVDLPNVAEFPCATCLGPCAGGSFGPILGFIGLKLQWSFSILVALPQLIDLEQLWTSLTQLFTHWQMLGIIRGMSFPIPLMDMNIFLFELPSFVLQMPFQVAFTSFTAFQPLVCMFPDLHAFQARMLMNWFAPYCVGLLGLVIYAAVRFFVNSRPIKKKFPILSSEQYTGQELLQELDKGLGIGAIKENGDQDEIVDVARVSKGAAKGDHRAHLQQLRDSLFVEAAAGATADQKKSSSQSFLTPVEREYLAAELAKKRIEDDVEGISKKFNINIYIATSIAIRLVVLVLPTIAAAVYDVLDCMSHPVSVGKGISLTTSPGHVSKEGGEKFEVDDLLSLAFGDSFRSRQDSHKTHRRFRDIFCEDSAAYGPWISAGWFFIVVNIGVPLSVVGLSCYKTISSAWSDTGALTEKQKMMYGAVWSKFRRTCTEFALIFSMKNAFFPLWAVVSLPASSFLVTEFKFSDGFFQSVCGAAFLICYVVCVHKWRPYPQDFSNKMELMLVWSQIATLVVMGFSFSVPEIAVLPAGFVDERMLVLFIVQLWSILAPILVVVAELRREVLLKLGLRKGSSSGKKGHAQKDGQNDIDAGLGGGRGGSSGATGKQLDELDGENPDRPKDLITRNGQVIAATEFSKLDRVEKLRQRVLLYAEMMGMGDIAQFRITVSRMEETELREAYRGLETMALVASGSHQQDLLAEIRFRLPEHVADETKNILSPMQSPMKKIGTLLLSPLGASPAAKKLGFPSSPGENNTAGDKNLGDMLKVRRMTRTEESCLPAGAVTHCSPTSPKHSSIRGQSLRAAVEKKEDGGGFPSPQNKRE